MKPRRPSSPSRPTRKAPSQAAPASSAVSLPPGAVAGSPTGDAAFAKAARLFALHEFKAAKRQLDELIRRAPDHALAYQLRSQVLARGMLRPEEAMDDLDASLTMLGEDPRGLRLKAELLLRLGRGEEAGAIARRAVAVDPADASSYRVIERASETGLSADHIAAIETLVEDAAVAPERRRILRHILARRADRAGDAAAAFEQFRRGNALIAGTYEPARHAQEVAALSAGLTAEFFAERRGWGLKEARQLFIIGMPRSGSTLVEQALTAHPQLESGGETNALAKIERFLFDRLTQDPKPDRRSVAFLQALSKPDCRLAANKYEPLLEPHFERKAPRKMLDKTLQNVVRLPLMALLFPNHVAIHTFRHPLDTALSCFQQSFAHADFTSRLDWIAAYWRSYCAMIELWERLFPGRLVHVCHEEMIADFDAGVRGLVARCGLAWSEACAKPHENTRFVYTASAEQVRRPVNRAGVAKWRRYEAPLAPLIEAMGGLGAIEAQHERFKALAAASR